MVGAGQPAPTPRDPRKNVCVEQPTHPALIYGNKGGRECDVSHKVGWQVCRWQGIDLEMKGGG